MHRADRRHSVAESPSKVPQKNSPKKTNARAVFAFRLKKILDFNREESPLPLPMLRPGGGGLSPIVTRKRMTRSESLPAMRLSLSSCMEDHNNDAGAAAGGEGEKPSGYEHFHADLCARIANLAETEATEAAQTCDASGEKYLTSEDGSDSIVQVEHPGDDEVSASMSNSVTSSLDEERVSEEMQCMLRFSPLGITEDEEKTDDGRGENDFVAVVRPHDEKEVGTPTAQRALVGEVSYSPIHTSAYGMRCFVTSEEDRPGGEDLSFNLMLHPDDEAREDDGLSTMPPRGTHSLTGGEEDEEGAPNPNDYVEVADGASGSEDSAGSELGLSISPSSYMIASSEADDGREIDAWESADNESSNDIHAGDGASTCSIREHDSTPLSLAETITSSSAVVESDSRPEEVEAGVENAVVVVNLALGYLDTVLEGVSSMNSNTHLREQAPAVDDDRRFDHHLRIDDDEGPHEDTWVEAEVESTSAASSTPVSTFNSSVGGDEEMFTELPSAADMSFYAVEGVAFAEETEDVEFPTPVQFPARGVVHRTQPFRFDDAILDEHGYTPSASNMGAGSCIRESNPTPASLQSSSDEGMMEKEEEPPTQACHATVNALGNVDVTRRKASRVGTKIAIGLSVIVSIAAVFGTFKMISSPHRLLGTQQLTNTDCRKILRDLGWIKNHHTVKIDGSFRALDGAAWNTSGVLAAPCEVVLATQTPEEIALYEFKMHQAYDAMEAESRASRDGRSLSTAGVEGRLILCLAFTLLAWALLQYDSLS